MHDSISRYRLLKELDPTRPRTVYLAEDPIRGKVILRLFPDAAARDLEAFRRSAQAWIELDHPNMTPVLDTGEHDGQLFVITRFVEGMPLAEFLRHTRMPSVDALGLMFDLASALAYLHRRGIVHGNLHPSSLIVGVGGGITLVDLHVGLLGRTRPPDDDAAIDADAVRYASPERVTGAIIDSRSDIFTFGAILYEALTGRPAFPGNDVAQILSGIRNAPPDLLDASSSLDAALVSLIERCLEKDPERRYRDLEQILSQLEAIRRKADRLAPLAAHASKQVAVRALDENVQFTVYRRSVVAPLRWYPMLAFAHLAERRPDAPADEPDPVAEVQRQAKQVLGEDAADFQQVVQDSGRPIPQRGHLRFVPDVKGVEFNPLERSFLWTESVHREEFRLRASPALDGRVARGVVAVYLGHLLVAEIVVAIRVNSLAVGAEPIADDARRYRRIFASYSHRDTAIVEELEDHVQSLGDEYLRDVTQLRSGEVWSPRLAEMIATADVFQLFWSWNALQSPFVRAEWEHALALRRGHFIRPVYWESPFPSTTDLPPPSLRALHFKLIRPRSVARQELDPLELLDLVPKQAPARKAKAPTARDLDLGSSLDKHFQPPDAVLPAPAPAPAPASAPRSDAIVIPHGYNPLAPDSGSFSVPSSPPAPPTADFAAVLEGAGLDPADVTPELARTFGQILRVVVAGVMDVMRSRQEIKDEFRMRMSGVWSNENNPLKFSANVDDALYNLLVKRHPAYLTAVEAFEDVFNELRNHQIAMLAGMRVAFESMLAEFDPDRLQQEFDRQPSKGLMPKLGYWDLYRERRHEMVIDPEGHFRRLFGEEFARAYEERLTQLKSRGTRRGMADQGAT